MIDLIDYFKTGEMGYNNMALATGSLRGGVSSNVDWNVKGHDLFDFAYGTVMSGLDSAIANGIGGNLGPVMQGLTAFGSEANDAIDRGLTDKQALKAGLVAGGNEMLWEALSLGKLKGFKAAEVWSKSDALKNLGKLVATNATEEMATDAANMLYDRLAHGDKSRYSLDLQAYMEAGMTEAEAKAQVVLDNIDQVFQSGVSGGLMGLGFGGSGAVSQFSEGAYYDNRAKKRRNLAVGKLMGAENGVQGLQELAAKSIDDLSGRAANRMKRRSAAVENDPTFKNVGKLYDAVAGANNKTSTSEIAAALMEKGVPKRQANELADYVVRLNQFGGITADNVNMTVDDIIATVYGPDDKAAAQIADSLVGMDRNTGSMVNTSSLTSGAYGQEIGTSKRKAQEIATATEAVRSVLNETVLNNSSAMSQRQATMSDLEARAATEQLAAELEKQGVAPETAAQLAEMAVQGTMPQDTVIGEQSPSQPVTADSSLSQGSQSAEGQVLYEGQPVQVAKVKSAGNGPLIVQLADGASVDASKLSFPDQGQQELYQIVGKIADSAGTANLLLAGLDEGNASAGIYARAIEQAFFYGRHQIPLEQLVKESPYAQALTSGQLHRAYNLGLAAGKKTGNKSQSNIDTTYNQARDMLKQTGREKPGEYSAEIAEGVDVEHMDEGQRGAYELARQIAPAVQCNIICYMGNKGWGFYDHNTDTLHINVNAKWNKRSMMAFTLGHELVHRAAAGSPKQYRAFAKFLMEQYHKQGLDINKMIREQMYWAEQAGNKLTWDQAFEEVVADACQRMLVDTDAGKKLAQWGAQSQQNKSFLRKVKTIIEDILDRLRSYFKNVDNDSLAAREFARIDKNAKQILADMFVDMSIDAGEKLSTIKAAGMLNKNTAQQGGRQYKLNVNAAIEVNKALYDKTYDNEVLLRDETPAIMLAQKGVRNIPMAMNASHIRENVFTEAEAKQLGLPVNSRTHYHGLGETFFLQIIDGLNNVKEAYRGTKYANNPARRENYFLLISEFKDENGNTINVPVYIDEHAQCNKVFIDANKISTAFGRDNFRVYINKQVADKNLIRIKNRSNQASEHRALIAERYGKDASNDSIRNEREDVKQNLSNKTQIGEDISPRELLLNIVEGMVANDTEYKKLQEYRQKIQELNATEEHLERLNEQLRQLYFAEGGRDYEMINKLEGQRAEALTKLNRYDSQLINLENTKPIRDIVNRMKQAAYDRGFRKAKDYYKQKADAREEKLKQHYQESRRNAVERHDKAQIRQQIRKDVERLASLLNKGNKQKNVKQELQAVCDLHFPILISPPPQDKPALERRVCQ